MCSILHPQISDTFLLSQLPDTREEKIVQRSKVHVLHVGYLSSSPPNPVMSYPSLSTMNVPHKKQTNKKLKTLYTG